MFLFLCQRPKLAWSGKAIDWDLTEGEHIGVNNLAPFLLPPYCQGKEGTSLSDAMI